MTACGTRANAYQLQSAAARRAYAHGRYLEAADRWAQAEREAETTSDRDEAAYRRAASLERGGKTAEAIAAFDELVARNPQGPRGARSLLDLARIAADAGNEARSQQWIIQLIRQHPNSAAAETALGLRAGWLRRTRPDSAPLELRTLAKEVAGTHLEERAVYEVARTLEQRGALEASRDAYLETAERFPYPTGALWDDALWRAADIEARLDHPRRAIAVLERMLSARESSGRQGSYERPRYAQARYRIAELYRDSLSDPERARQQFRHLWQRHPTSRLRDDAKWQEALLAHRAGDGAGACRAARELVEGAPESRFVNCAPLVCNSLAIPPKGPCHRYIARTVGTPEPD